MGVEFLASQLSELLASKGRPVICNGKLLRKGKQLIYVRYDQRFNPVFTVRTKPGVAAVTVTDEGETAVTEREPEILDMTEQSLHDIVLKFDMEYGPNWGDWRPPTMKDDKVEMHVDPFLKAVVVTSDIYRREMNIESHKVTSMYKDRAHLLLEYISDYFDIYSYLINRKLMGNTVPMVIKGHLISGFFQPLYCGTKYIPSPLDYPVYNKFYETITSWETSYGSRRLKAVIDLIEMQDKLRNIQLRVASMYDIANMLESPNVYRGGRTVPAERIVPKQLDRRIFMFMFLEYLSLMLLTVTDQLSEADTILHAQHRQLYESIMNKEGSAEFLNRMILNLYDNRQMYMDIR